jgi:ribosome-associated protein YbcJ (S4-like RNA binding protein)
MTLIPQLSQKPNARAKTRRRTLADGPVCRDDLVGIRRGQAVARGQTVLMPINHVMKASDQGGWRGLRHV